MRPVTISVGTSHLPLHQLQHSQLYISCLWTELDNLYLKISASAKWFFTIFFFHQTPNTAPASKNICIKLYFRVLTSYLESDDQNENWVDSSRREGILRLILQFGMKDIAVYEVDELEARLVPTGLVTDLYLDPLWCVVFTHYTL